jgi:predicted nucleotidyltransferase
MLHSKYSEILGFFLGDYKKQIYGRELIGKIGLSPKGIANSLKELESQGILKSKKEGSVKFYSLNLKSPSIKEILIQAEISNKLAFLSKHKKIAHLLKEDDRIIGIFGSYAKGTQKADSDVDMFVVGGKSKGDYNDKGKPFDIEINIIYFSEKEFKKLLAGKNNLVREILESHILIFGFEGFVSLLWKEYYGLN